MRSFNFFTTIVTAVHSAGNAETTFSVSLGWLQSWQCYEGSKLVQNNEIGKLACGPSLTMRCVGVKMPNAIEQQIFVQNFVLRNFCEFCSNSIAAFFW
jgi:hypothetical protein